MEETISNKDEKVIREFSEEWTKFDFSSIDIEQINEVFDQYFSIFPWDVLPKDAVGSDMGCGTGRWAQLVAPKVKTLNCVEPSNANKMRKWLLSELLKMRFIKLF